MAKTQDKKIPAPILMAQEALKIMAAEDAAAAEVLKSKLPGFAMSLERAGEEVTVESLLEHAKQGEAHLATYRPSQLLTYEEVAQKFKPQQTTAPAQPANPADAKQEAINKLLVEIKSGSLKEALNIIENCPEETRVEIRSHALILAFQLKQKTIATELLKSEIDVHYAHDAAMAHAAQAGDIQLISLLHQKGASLDKGAFYHPLSTAVSYGHKEAVSFMLSLGADIHSDNERALKSALQKGDEDLADLLIKHGADINANDGELLQNVILYTRKAETVRFCLQKGFDINKGNKALNTAIQANPTLAIILLENGFKADNIKLHEAVVHNNINLISLLLEKGVNIHAENEQALKRAIDHCSAEIVSLLLDHGADIHAQDGFLIKTALALKNAQVLTALTKHGVDLGVEMALPLAINVGDIETVKRLIKEGVDVTANNNAALYSATSSNNKELIRLLIENGADIHTHQEGALQLAIIHQDLEQVEWLLQHGADVHCSNESPLIGAIHKNNKELQELLIRYGADIGRAYDILVENYLRPGYVHYAQLEKDIPLEKLSPHTRKLYLDHIAQKERWEKIAHCKAPEGLLNKDPAYYNPALFETSQTYLKKEYPYNVQSVPVYSICALFGTEQRLLQYFAKWGKPGPRPLFDLVHGIGSPDGSLEKVNLKAWGDAALKCGPAMAKMFAYARGLTEPEKSADGKTWSYPRTRDKLAESGYERSTENVELSRLCFEHNVTEQNFNKALDLVLAQKKDIVKNIPDIIIDGEAFDLDGATFHPLPANDIRGLFLGEIVNCCQSIGSNAERCAIQGFTSENGGFYVIETDKHEIIGESWAWRGKEGELVFDSLETLGGRVSAEQWVKLAEAFGKALERKPGNVSTFRIGTGGGTYKLQSPFQIADAPASCVDPVSYGDSARQYVVWTKKKRSRPPSSRKPPAI